MTYPHWVRSKLPSLTRKESIVGANARHRGSRSNPTSPCQTRTLCPNETSPHLFGPQNVFGTKDLITLPERCTVFLHLCPEEYTNNKPPDGLYLALIELPLVPRVTKLLARSLSLIDCIQTRPFNIITVHIQEHAVVMISRSRCGTVECLSSTILS